MFGGRDKRPRQWQECRGGSGSGNVDIDLQPSPGDVDGADDPGLIIVSDDVTSYPKMVRDHTSYADDLYAVVADKLEAVVADKLDIGRRGLGTTGLTPRCQ
jgi:hypothetical protein